MRAFVITEAGKTTFIEKEDPRPGAGEVLLAIRRAGFCGSDLSTFRGLNPLVSYPRIPGHELGAVILEYGIETQRKIPIGSEVLVMPYTSCEKCSSCRQGRFNCCRYNQTLGVQREGGICEKMVVPESKILQAPGLSLAELALVEPLTVGFHAVHRARVTSHDTVLVFGCGAIGLGAIAGAAQRQATVIAVDLDPEKLALAKKAGASIGIDSGKENLHERLQEITQGEGPAVVIEAVGLPATFRAAVEEVCFGGRVVYIGYAKTPVEYETKYFVQKEIDIMGSRNATAEDFEAVIRMLQKKEYPVAETLTQTVPFDRAGEALAEWSKNPGKVTKIQIHID